MVGATRAAAWVAWAITLLGLTVTAQAQTAKPIELTEDLALEAEGGVGFRVPAWKKDRHESAIAVFERATSGDAGDQTFFMLLLAVEPGPPAGTAVEWEQVRQNIVSAGSRDGGGLQLAIRGAFEGPAGFEAQRMSGSLTAREQTIAVDLVALVSEGKLVTVTVLSMKSDVVSTALTAAVAQSVSLGR